MSQMQAVALALFVERALQVKQWIEALGAGAGVAKYVKIPAGSVSSFIGCGWPGS